MKFVTDGQSLLGGRAEFLISINLLVKHLVLMINDHVRFMMISFALRPFRRL